MHNSSYGERDYAFGQVMLTLRANIGLTQAGLADLLHVSRRAVGEWEAGSNYPKTEHLKRLIELGVQQQAFTSGREEVEIRALWQEAHQKVLLDELWLHELLGTHGSRLVPLLPPTEEQVRTRDQSLAPSVSRPRVDWGEALAVPTFYGRTRELAQLSEWSARRFGPHTINRDECNRPYDVPWLVLDSTRAQAEWEWRPVTSLESILGEIADHAEQHPCWLDLSEGT